MSVDINRGKFIATAITFCGAAFCLGPAELQAAGYTAKPKENPMRDLTFDSLYNTSVSATALTGEAADRVAIRNLVDAWAHYADRRLAKQQAALFAEKGIVEIYNGASLEGRVCKIYFFRRRLRWQVWTWTKKE